MSCEVARGRFSRTVVLWLMCFSAVAFIAVVWLWPGALGFITRNDHNPSVGGAPPPSTLGLQSFRKRINFIAPNQRRTPNPPGWEPYDGSVYVKERGYGWLDELQESFDGGPAARIQLPDGVVTSPRGLQRLELANWQGAHRENRPLVFRIDLPNGWYRVTCTSAGHGVLPVVDQRSFRCRAHDAVFTGPLYGPPMKAKGMDLIEGSGIVEVTEEHLRIVVGDPSYGGWTWSYKGLWYRGWTGWWGKWGDYRYAETWYQKLTRVIDPGFHSLRLNSLEITRETAPLRTLIFRDFFNRPDSRDLNSGVVQTDRWIAVSLHPRFPNRIEPELYKTSLKVTGSALGKNILGMFQTSTSPEGGTVRYSTSVSLFTGEGSKIHRGSQEAGLLILADAAGPSEFNSTFIGVGFDARRRSTSGSVHYRVGDGRDGYKVNAEVPDTSLPFQVTEGEYEIVVDHNVQSNLLERIQINGKDITGWFSVGDRAQRVPRGVFGIRAALDPLDSGVTLQQFYWYYRVEDTTRTDSAARVRH